MMEPKSLSLGSQRTRIMKTQARVLFMYLFYLFISLFIYLRFYLILYPNPPHSPRFDPINIKFAG
jgi:hypothetical protein